MTLFDISFFLTIGWSLFALCAVLSRARGATKFLAVVWALGLGAFVGWAVALIVAPALLDHVIATRETLALISSMSGNGSIDPGSLFSGLFTTIGTVTVAVVYVPLRATPRMIRRAIEARAARNGGAA